MTTLTARTAVAAPPRPAWVAVTPDDSRRGRLNAAAFGAIVFFGLAFPMAVVLPGATLLAGEAAALVLATFAAGRLVGATDRRGWLRTALWVVGAVLIMALAMAAVLALVVWGPIAP
jgi:hypothetical protein